MIEYWPMAPTRLPATGTYPLSLLDAKAGSPVASELPCVNEEISVVEIISPVQRYRSFSRIWLNRRTDIAKIGLAVSRAFAQYSLIETIQYEVPLDQAFRQKRAGPAAAAQQTRRTYPCGDSFATTNLGRNRHPVA